ncbi:MAG: hypothetical protein SFY95_09155 [Planctomycetota bacterium]|nr:hypothetical protein [Planctomycetota bacterium]
MTIKRAESPVERVAALYSLPQPIRFKAVSLTVPDAEGAVSLSEDELRSRSTLTREFSFLVFPNGDVRRGSPSIDRYTDRDGFVGRISKGPRTALFNNMDGTAEIVDYPSVDQAREALATTLPTFIAFAVRAVRERGEEFTESASEIRAGEWTWRINDAGEVVSWVRVAPNVTSTGQVLSRIRVPGVKGDLWSRVLVTNQAPSDPKPTRIVMVYDDYRLDPNADPLDVDWRSQAVKAVDWRTKEPIEFERVGPRAKASQPAPPKPTVASQAEASTPPAERTGPKAIRVGPDGLSDAQRGGLSRWSWLGIAGGSALVLAGIVLTVLRRRG